MILSYELASKVIDEISKLDLDEIKEEVENGESKWFTYKKYNDIIILNCTIIFYGG